MQGKNANRDQIVYQNADVRARARGNQQRIDDETRRDNGNTPLKNLLVPWEAQR